MRLTSCAAARAPSSTRGLSTAFVTQFRRSPPAATRCRSSSPTTRRVPAQRSAQRRLSGRYARPARGSAPVPGRDSGRLRGGARWVAAQRERERDDRPGGLDGEHDRSETGRRCEALSSRIGSATATSRERDEKPRAPQRQQVLDRQIGAASTVNARPSTSSESEAWAFLAPNASLISRCEAKAKISSTGTAHTATIPSACDRTGRGVLAGGAPARHLGHEVEAGAHRHPDEHLGGDRGRPVGARHRGREAMLGGDDVDVLQHRDHDQPGDRRPRPLDVGPQRHRRGAGPARPASVVGGDLARSGGAAATRSTAPMAMNDSGVPR